MHELSQEQLNEEIYCPWCDGSLGKRGDTPEDELVCGTHFHYCPHCTKMFAVARGRFYKVFLELGSRESDEEGLTSGEEGVDCPFCRGPIGDHRGAAWRTDPESDEPYPVRVCKVCDPAHNPEAAHPGDLNVH